MVTGDKKTFKLYSEKECSFKKFCNVLVALTYKFMVHSPDNMNFWKQGLNSSRYPFSIFYKSCLFSQSATYSKYTFKWNGIHFLVNWVCINYYSSQTFPWNWLFIWSKQRKVVMLCSSEIWEKAGKSRKKQKNNLKNHCCIIGCSEIHVFSFDLCSLCGVLVGIF